MLPQAGQQLTLDGKSSSLSSLPSQHSDKMEVVRSATCNLAILSVVEVFLKVFLTALSA